MLIPGTKCLLFFLSQFYRFFFFGALHVARMHAYEIISFGAGHRVQVEEDVEVSQRNYPEHPKRHGLPRAHRHLQHPPHRAW